jgi:hypothetical protein
MNTNELKRLIDSGEFHHATYRNLGNLWEGLYIYRKAANSMGWELAWTFNRGMEPEALDDAEMILRDFRVPVCLGSYGNG